MLNFTIKFWPAHILHSGDKNTQCLQAAHSDTFRSSPLSRRRCFRFFRRQQEVGETVAEYEAELRRLATHCDYGAFLEQALRDRLVCGLRNEAAQKHLLSKANLMLEKALEIAQGMEAADSNTQDMKVRE